MRCILINPTLRTVTEHDIEPKLAAMQELLGFETICSFRFHAQVHCYVDDEGLYRRDPVRVTMFRDYPYPVAGNVLVWGIPTPDGEETPCPLSVDEVRACIEDFGVLK